MYKVKTGLNLILAGSTIYIKVSNYHFCLQVAAQAARQRRRKKRRTRAADSFCNGTFDDLYYITDELLGEGAYATVWTCVNKYTNVEYAVKVNNRSDRVNISVIEKEIKVGTSHYLSTNQFSPYLLIKHIFLTLIKITVVCLESAAICKPE